MSRGIFRRLSDRLFGRRPPPPLGPATIEATLSVTLDDVTLTATAELTPSVALSLATKRNHQVAYVLVFEGLGVAFASTADIDGISAAWDDTPWQPTPGGSYGTTASWYQSLFYPDDVKQEIELFNPSVKAGSLKVSVTDPTDAIAALAFANASSAQRTYLTEDLAPDATTIPVKETAAFASSGEYLVYIGQEAILVDGANKTSTGWTLAERAQWALFETEDGSPFAPPHRINRQTDLAPIVSTSPRTGFHNRNCQVWMHVKKDDGSWSTKAEAQCIWTGRCKGVQDNGKRKLTFDTVLISDLLDTRFFEDQFTGRIAEGRYLAASQTFCYVQEFVHGGLDNRIELSLANLGGMVTAQDVIDSLNNALVESESGLRFAWSVGKSDDGNVEITVKTGVGTDWAASIIDLYHFRIGLDRAVWDLLGYPRTVDGSVNVETGGSDGRNSVNVREVPFGQVVSGVGTWMLVAENRPIKYDFAHFRNLQRRIRLDEDTRGTWAPQPVTTRVFGGQALGEGFLQIADMAVVFGYFDEKNSNEFVVLEDATQVFQNLSTVGASNPWLAGAIVREGEVSNIEVRQIWWERNPLRDILLRLMLSTGTAGYNDADYDQLPAGFGLAVPTSLIDKESFQQLAGIDGWTLLINKPTAFLRILESGIAAHGRHLVYRDGQLALVEPKLDGPTIAVAWELNEDNKADPRDRPSAEQGADGILNRVELKYDRDLNGNFRSRLVLEDIVSSTDYNQKRAIEVEAWGLETGDDGRQGFIDKVASKVLAFASQPMTLIERTVDKTMHGRIAPGDTVLLADDYSMNPRTGVRGLTAQPAWVLGTILEPSKFRTRVRLAYSAAMAVDKICAWAPSVRLDHTALDEGYIEVDPSTRYLACLPYQYDGQNEGVGVERFEVGDLLIVRELSPPATRDPYLFHVEVESIDDDPTAPKIYLADPIVGWAVGTSVKKYIVTPDVIGTVQQAQRRDTFIADDATDTTGASANDSYEWGATRALGTSAAPTLTQQPIRLPFPLEDYLTGQGYPLAVADLYELVLSLNSLYAYGTRHHAGCGAWTHAAAVTSGTTRELAYGPVWVPLVDRGARDLLVKLRAKSSDGSSLRFIITTSRSLPVGQEFHAAALEFRDDTESLGEAEVFTTSTTLAWLDETPVACYPEPGALGVWLTIEADATSGTGTLEGVCIQEDKATTETGAPSISEGAKPSDWGILNRCTASGPAMSQIIGYLNQLLERRIKVHAAWWTWASNPVDPDSSFRARIFCSSRCQKLRVRFLIEAVRYAASAQPFPSIKLYMKSIDASDSEEQVIGDEGDGYVHNFRDTTIGPMTWRWVEFEIDLGDWFDQTGGTYEVRLEQIDLLQIRSMTISEKQRIIIPPADSVPLATPIYDALLADVWEAYRDLLHDQRQVLFTWSTQDGGQARAIPAATASLVNIFDTSQVGYAAAAAGFWCWPENCGTFESDDVDVVVWVMLDFDNTVDAAERYVSFVTALGTIATIEQPAYNGGSSVASLALQCKWSDAGALTSAKIDVLAKNTDAAGMTVYAAGAYLKIPLDPRTIADLAVWLAADRITGLSDGGAVSSWADSSGNGNHATQGTAANRPTYETNEWQGKPVVRFDGSNDHLTIADSATFKGTKLTVFVVSKSAAGAAGVDTLVGYPQAAASTDWRWAMQVNATTNKFSLAYPGVGAGDEVSAGDACNNAWRVWTFESFDFVGRRDGIGKIEFDLDTALSYPNAVGLFVGANGNGAEPWQGDIAEILIYNRELTAAERQKVEVYLAEKYGLVRGQNWDS